MNNLFSRDKRMILTLTSMFLLVSIWNSHSQTYKNISSIFENGDSLISCETNFTNLKKSFIKQNIVNANEYTILDYRFLSVITDDAQIVEYSNLLSAPDALVGIVYVTIDDKQKVNGFSKAIFSLSIEDLESVYNRLKNSHFTLSNNSVWGRSRQDYALKIKNMLKIGYRIYVLTFEKDGKKYEDLVFCDPKSFKVILDSFFMRIHLIPAENT